MANGVTRRGFVGASALAIAGLAMGGRHALGHDGHDDGTPVASPASPVGGDVPRDAFSGGGTLRTAYGEATFSLTAFPGVDSAGEPVVQGSFVLEDQSESSNPVSILTEWLDSYGPYSASLPDARQIIGWARMNGADPVPFLLQLEDLGIPGGGEDTFNLVLGADAQPFLGGEAKDCDCGGISYSLRSNVVTGDLARFELD